MGLISWFLFHIICYWHLTMLLIFLCWFHILYMYSINLFVLTAIFIWFSEFYVYQKLLSSIGGNLAFFPIWVPFISFSCLIAMARLKHHVEETWWNRHKCHVLNLFFSFYLIIFTYSYMFIYCFVSLTGNAISFSPFNMTFAVALLWMSFILFVEHLIFSLYL
jgi:hypothetical protein